MTLMVDWKSDGGKRHSYAKFAPLKITDEQWRRICEIVPLPDEARELINALLSDYFGDLHDRAGCLPLHRVEDLISDIPGRAESLHKKVDMLLESLLGLRAVGADLPYWQDLSARLKEMPDMKTYEVGNSEFPFIQ